MSRGARLLIAVISVAVSVTAIGTGIWLWVSPTYETPGAAGIVPSATAATTTLPAAAGVRATAHQAAGVPTQLRLPALGVTASIVPVGLAAGGTLAVPADPHVLGWWEEGAAPGEALGTVVIDGHVDTWNAGDGALFHLASARPGERIVLRTSAGPVTYVIVGRRTYLKASLPRSVFASYGRPRLVVITCGGPFDWTTRHYLDNVVVYALPAAHAPTYRRVRIGRLAVSLGPATHLWLWARPVTTPIRAGAGQVAFVYLDRLVGVRSGGRLVHSPTIYTTAIEAPPGTFSSVRAGAAVTFEP
jgi:hypothetical protein